MIFVAAFVAAGLLAAAVLGRPEPVVELLEERAPGVVFSVDTERPLVALTIDDGPSDVTPEILDVLAEHHARATFFLIGSHIDDHPDEALLLARSGHELANHLMEDEPSIRLSPDEFDEQILAAERRLRPLGAAHLLRPGAGWVNERMVEQAALRGYRVILGSVYPLDAHVPAPSVLSWYVLRNVQAGSIVVLHDGDTRGQRTVEVLRSVLPELRRRGLRVVTVSELLAAGDAEDGDRGGAAVP